MLHTFSVGLVLEAIALVFSPRMHDLHCPLLTCYYSFVNGLVSFHVLSIVLIKWIIVADLLLL